MKKLLTVLAISACSFSALADHSLADAMSSDSQISMAVSIASKKAKLICDTERSLQMTGKVNGRVKLTASGISAAWRQVALCYKTKAAMLKDRQILTSGNQYGGLYGLNADGILDVTYTSDRANGKNTVLEISLK